MTAKVDHRFSFESSKASTSQSSTRVSQPGWEKEARTRWTGPDDSGRPSTTLQNTPCRLKDCFSRLGGLHALQFRTSVTINWEYWRLGKS